MNQPISHNSLHADMAWKEYLELAKELINNKKFLEAEIVIVHALDKFPNQLSLLLTANSIFRELRNREKSLEHAQRIIKYHPEYFDGYARAAQDLCFMKRYQDAVTQVNAGLERFPTEYYTLWTAALIYRNIGNYEKALEYDKKIIAYHPSKPQGYICSVQDLIKSCNYREAEHIALDGLKIFPSQLALMANLITVYRAMGNRKESLKYGQELVSIFPTNSQGYISVAEDLLVMGKYQQAKRILYLYISRSSTQLQRCVQLLDEIDFSQSIALSPKIFLPNNQAQCDVCCIAGNEAPYISEFVHHYLYLGFDNIVIGINNISDLTKEILLKIRTKHANLHIVEIDDWQNTFRQTASYRVLFDYARLLTNSTHCLFVDVDEFWVADPFPTSVSEFIGKHVPFDVFSFHWINCYNETLFSPPFGSHVLNVWNPHLKSMVSYNAPLANLGIHAPALSHVDKDVICKLGNSVNRNVMPSHKGEHKVFDISTNRKLSYISDKNNAWIFHRIQRSELEYSYKLFQPLANAASSAIFKTNRPGYVSVKQCHNETANVPRIMPNSEVSLYHHSLEEFIGNCQLSNLISRSRDEISDSWIRNKISSMPKNLVSRDASIWRRTFQNTQYLDLLESCLPEGHIHQ